MGKAPAFQFYPGDWFREPGLRTADIIVRGCWAETLFTMHDSTPRGVLNYSILGLARLWRVHPQMACHVVRELDVLHIADVEYQDEETRQEIEKIALDCAYTGLVSEEAKEPGSFIGIQEGANEFCVNQRRYSALFVRIKSRRMHKEWIFKENERLRGKQRRENSCVQKISRKSPPPSSSSSSSSKKESRKKESARTPFSLPEWFPPEAWSLFLDHRKKIRAPVTEKAYQRMVQKFEKLMAQGWPPEKAVDVMIEKGWRWLDPTWESVAKIAAPQPAQAERTPDLDLEDRRKLADNPDYVRVPGNLVQLIGKGGKA